MTHACVIDGKINLLLTKLAWSRFGLVYQLYLEDEDTLASVLFYEFMDQDEGLTTRPPDFYTM